MQLKFSHTCSFFLCFILLNCTSTSKTIKKYYNNDEVKDYPIKALLYKDNFSNTLDNWIIETDTTRDTKIELLDNALNINVDCGATVWLNKKLSGNLMIVYDRKAIVANGKNDRVSDINQFWMANDPKKSNLFTRNGKFNQYHRLQLYYFGIGGNNNTTTRFRKYEGNGNRSLITDLRDLEFLLKANTNYRIKTLIYNGVVKVYINNNLYFSFEDKSPYTSGYFGFRTTQSHQQIDNFKIYRL